MTVVLSCVAVAYAALMSSCRSVVGPDKPKPIVLHEATLTEITDATALNEDLVSTTNLFPVTAHMVVTAVTA